MKKTKISNKWWKMAEIYKRFSQIRRIETDSQYLIDIWDKYDADRDFSKEAATLAYRKESLGEPCDIRMPSGKINGYIEGKQWMDLTLTEYWIPDVQSREILEGDLLEDFPEWFIDKVFNSRA